MVLSKREFIKDIILEQQHNNKIAIEDEKEHITYRELHNTCTKISETIQRESDCKNNRNVGIFLNNSVDYAKAYFSIAYMDRTIIPVEVTLSKEQIVSILDYCEISTIITNKKYFEQLTNSLQDYEYFMEIFCIEENKLYQFEGKSRLLSESMESGVSVQDTAIMLHTSGTTSNPKRVMLTHNNLITNVKSNIKSLKLNEEDKSLIVLPMYFGYCNSSQFLTHMYLGASVVIAPQPFNPARFLSFIEKYSITNTTCIPSMLFLTIAMKKKYDLTSLRYLCFGGGLMPVEKLEKIISYFSNTSVIQTYGLTEASPRVTCLLPEDAFKKIGSVGKAIPDVTVDVVDENGISVNKGERGEIVVKGNNVMKGYYKHPEATSKVLKNGWLHTGDIGMFDQDGYLYIVGRIKNLIISGGLNIYPEEIEEVITSIDGVKEVLVVSEKHDLLGEVPVAKIVTDGTELVATEIISYCRQKLDSHKIPKRVIFCEKLEKTYNGKIKRG